MRQEHLHMPSDEDGLMLHGLLQLPQGEVRGALDHIERCFFGAADEFTQPTDAVELYEAGSAYSECGSSVDA